MFNLFSQLLDKHEDDSKPSRTIREYTDPPFCRNANLRRNELQIKRVGYPIMNMLRDKRVRGIFHGNIDGS